MQCACSPPQKLWPSHLKGVLHLGLVQYVHLKKLFNLMHGNPFSLLEKPEEKKERKPTESKKGIYNTLSYTDNSWQQLCWM